MKRGLSEICYGFFSTLSNPTRLAILEKLRGNSMNVTGLAEVLEQEQSMISHNLKALEKCNLVSSERKGKEKIYNVNPETVEGLLRIVENHAVKYCSIHGTCRDSR